MGRTRTVRIGRPARTRPMVRPPGTSRPPSPFPRGHGAMSGAKLLDYRSPPDGAGDPIACLATTFTFEADFFIQDCLSRFLSLSTVGSEGDRISSVAALLEEEDRLSEAQISVL